MVIIENGTMRMITRVITFGWKWWCYDERITGDEDKCSAYESDWNESPVEETGYFSGLPRSIWAADMKNKFEELIKDQGEKDCLDITQGQYLHLCKYEIVTISIESRIGERRILEEEEELIEIPVAPVVPVAPVIPTVPCPEADIALYKEIQKRLTGFRKQIVKLEAIRDALRQKERTNTEVVELRKTINNLEHYLQMESKDIDQLNRLKEKCPDIEELIR